MKTVDVRRIVRPWTVGRGGRRLAVLCALGGVLLGVSFPKIELWPLAWVALVPLLLATEGLDKLRSFLLGWLYGLGFFLVILYWLAPAMANYGNIPVPLSYLITLILVAYLSLYIGLFALATSYCAEGGPALKWVSAPFIWAGVEYLRGHFIFGGFPWAAIAYSQYKFPGFIQIADITGIYGPGFLVAMANSAVAFFLASRGRKLVFQEADGAKRGAAVYIVVTASLLASTLAYGYAKLSAAPYPGRNPARLKVALVQGNIDQAVKWDQSYQDETMAIYGDLTRSLAGEKPDLVVWPETAIPYLFDEGGDVQDRLADTARRASTHLLFGSRTVERDPDGNRYFNSAYLLAPDGRTLGRYDKIHLVPFGEYVPLKKALFPDFQVKKKAGEFESGQRKQLMALGEHKFSVLICFEIIFPALVRQFVDSGARFIVNITNDGWWGETSAPYQHISMAVFRAVENRVPIARAANTGVSAFIDQYGRIISPTDLYKRRTLVGEMVFDKSGKTFYSSYGDIFIYVMIAIAAVIFTLRIFNWRDQDG